MLTEFAKKRMAEIDALINGGMSIKAACKQVGSGQAWYYVQKKKMAGGTTKKRKKYKKSHRPFVQEVPVFQPQATARFICLIGDPRDVMKALGELR
jgi:hypothetical protein